MNKPPAKYKTGDRAKSLKCLSCNYLTVCNSCGLPEQTKDLYRNWDGIKVCYTCLFVGKLTDLVGNE